MRALGAAIAAVWVAGAAEGATYHLQFIGEPIPGVGHTGAPFEVNFYLDLPTITSQHISTHYGYGAGQPTSPIVSSTISFAGEPVQPMNWESGNYFYLETSSSGRIEDIYFEGLDGGLDVGLDTGLWLELHKGGYGWRYWDGGYPDENQHGDGYWSIVGYTLAPVPLPAGLPLLGLVLLALLGWHRISSSARG